MLRNLLLLTEGCLGAALPLRPARDQTQAQRINWNKIPLWHTVPATTRSKALWILHETLAGKFEVIAKETKICWMTWSKRLESEVWTCQEASGSLTPAYQERRVPHRYISRAELPTLCGRSTSITRLWDNQEYCLRGLFIGRLEGAAVCGCCLGARRTRTDACAAHNQNSLM